MAGAGIIEQARAGERQHGPHPLAATGNQMPGKLGNQRDLRLHAIKDDAVHRIEVLRHQRHDRIKAGGGGCRARRAANRMNSRGHGLRCGKPHGLRQAQSAAFTQRADRF